MNTTDIAAVRELITYAKANGWDHAIYGGSFGIEHVWWNWRAGNGYAKYAKKVTLADGLVEYFEPDNRLAKSAIRPETAAEVADWLRLLGLLPTVAQTAEAALVAS